MDTSYLSQQITLIIGQLHGLFDEIGVPEKDRDARESQLFSALSESLHGHLRHVTNEKHEMVEEANRLIKTIKQMEASLDDTRSRDYGREEAKITFPLNQCLEELKRQYNVVSKLHRERFEQVKKLVQALESYASHLEPTFVKIKLPPTSENAVVSPSFDLSPSYVASVDDEFTRVYEEYTRRVDIVRATCDEIIKLWAELGTPQAQTDTSIVKYSRDAPEQLGLHQEDVTRLRQKKEKLVEEKRQRERRIKDLQSSIETLWDRLGVEQAERRGFLTSNRGCGLRTINEFEDELARLNELKRQNLHLFVEDARCRLQELWDGMYFSEEEMLEFTPAFSDVYSDALLSAHEAEINRLEALMEQRAPVLALIDKHRSIIKDRDDLKASSQDASRLMAKGAKGQRHDPGKLLREEKMRKRITKELPKVEAELCKVLDKFEEEYGRPFLVQGKRYQEEIAAQSAKAPPARSKTPSAAPPPRPKTAASNSRPGTVRGPPPRSKTPTATLGRGNTIGPSSTIASAHNGAGKMSPSKIPARAPLSNMLHGNNSPERKGTNTRQGTGAGAARKMAPPPALRNGPPKMRDLVSNLPSPSRENHLETPMGSSRGGYFDNSEGSVVRSAALEDPYDERLQQNTFARSQYDSRMPPPQVPHQQSHNGQSYNDVSTSHHPYNMRPPSVTSTHSNVSRSQYSSTRSANASSTNPSLASGASSRQISNTSSACSAGTMTTSNTASGSENWETYESDAGSDTEVYHHRHPDRQLLLQGGSEAEIDSQDAYYAALRAARARQANGNNHKRATPEGGYGSPGGGRGLAAGGALGGPGKRIRGIKGHGEEVCVVEQEDGQRYVRVDGSAASWDDEETF